MKYIALIIFAVSLLNAGKPVTLGQTWKFAEKNMLDEIQEHIANNKEQIEIRIKDAKAKLQVSAENYKAKNLEKLPKTTKADVYYPSMQYSLEADIKDQKGNILYPKGYSYNISDFLKLPYKIIVIDATDKAQVEWYLNSAYAKAIDAQIMTVDGTISYLRGAIKNRPFFYFNKKMVERFDIKTVPSVIEQEGKRIKVTQIVVQGKDK